MAHKKTTVNISEYRLKSVTVSQTSSGKYYASILFEYEYQVQEKELQKFLGLDFFMHELYRDSNGKEPAYPASGQFPVYLLRFFRLVLNILHNGQLLTFQKKQ